jgi:hypothetical protein
MYVRRADVDVLGGCGDVNRSELLGCGGTHPREQVLADDVDGTNATVSSAA